MRKVLSFLGFLFILAQVTQAQYLETFSTANKGILGGPCTTNDPTTCSSNDFAGVNWTITGDLSGMDGTGPDDFRTSGGVMTSLNGDIDEEVCWVSPLLDISAVVGTVSFIVDVSVSGHDASDYLDIEYDIDQAGTWTQIANLAGGGTHTIDFGTNNNNHTELNAGASGLSGSTLQIRVCADFNSNTESFTIDDVEVPENGVTIFVACTDMAPPTITCPVTQTRDLDANCDYLVEDFTGLATTTDDCGPVVVTQSPTIGSTLSGVGDNTVTLTATDGASNTATCTFTLTLEDNTGPNALCQDITIDINGSVTLDPSDVDGGSNDPCSPPVSLSVSPNMFDCNSLVVGTSSVNSTNVAVTLTVTDQASNTSTCTADVQLERAPSAICMDATVDVSGDTTLDPNLVYDPSNTTCNPPVSLSVSPNMVSCSDFFVATSPVNSINVAVTLTVSDGGPNSRTCSATVTYQKGPPTAICQDVTVELNAGGMATVNANDVNDGSMSCLSQSFSVSPSSFVCTDIGAQTVTLTATNSAGSSTCTATATVEDNLAPTAQCQDITVQLSSPAISGSDVDGGSSDNCTNPPGLSVSPSSFTCNELGANTVTLTVDDNNGQTATCTASVTVEDDVAPTAVCMDATVQLSSPTLSGSDVDGGSTDNCTNPPSLSVSPSSFTCNELGTNTVTLTVDDTNGNTSTCTATVTVQDDVPPTAICQNATVQLDGTGNGTLMASQVDNGSNDNCTNPVALSVSPNAFSCSNIGTPTDIVTLTATDASGNSSTCTAVVTTQDNAPPTAVCQDFTLNLTSAGTTNLNASDVDGGSSTACGGFSSSVSPNSFTCNDIGPHTVTLTITDNSNGGTSTCTAVVTVQDPNSFCCAAPVAMCNDQTVQLDGSGDASVSASAVGAGSTADCGLASETVSPSDFDCMDIGPNTVTYTITDINGSSSSCTATVTVEDNMPPTAGCQNTTIQLDMNGDGGQTAAAVESGSTDNCGTVNTVSLSPDIFGCADVGGNNVTLTVNDGNGNTATCSAIVTVEDNVAPMAMCQDATVQLDANGDGTLLATDVDNGSSDACGVASVSVSPASFDCSNLGGNTVTLEATDNNGNNSTCTATATVEDNLPPVAVCLNNTVFLGPDGTYTLQDVDVLDFILSSDNCDNVSVIDVDPANVDCDDEGQTLSVDVTIEDDSGNPDQCTAMITVEQGGALPPPWTANDIGGSNGDASFAPCDGIGGKFTIDAMGFSLPNSDKQEFVSQSMCGNGELIARVCGVTGGGWAGIQMRETLATGSKKVVLKTQLTPIIRRDIRQSTNGFAQSKNIPRPFNDAYLRLVRQGNFFIGYTSVNGINWQFTFYAMVPMSSCIEVGLYVESVNVNTTTTGQFDNIFVNGVPVNPLSGPLPGVDIAEAPGLMETLEVYPNPTSGETFLDLVPFLGKEVSIRVFSGGGQLMQTIKMDQVEEPIQRLDLSGYQGGLYLIQVETPDQPTITRKLLLVGER